MLVAPDTRLVDIIDFKWLMAAVGRRVHVERMQSDPDYALQCLREGASSHVPALRAVAGHLAEVLSLRL